MDSWLKKEWGMVRLWRWPVIGLSIALVAICVVAWNNYDLAKDVEKNTRQIAQNSSQARRALCSLARLVRLSAPYVSRYHNEPIEIRLRRQTAAYAFLRGIDPARCRPSIDGVP